MTLINHTWPYYKMHCFTHTGKISSNNCLSPTSPVSAILYCNTLGSQLIFLFCFRKVICYTQFIYVTLPSETLETHIPEINISAIKHRHIYTAEK